jgi:hypothetical protein
MDLQVNSKTTGFLQAVNETGTDCSSVMVTVAE